MRWSRCPKWLRMWSPWWLRRVLAVQNEMHERTMRELRQAEASRVLRDVALEALRNAVADGDPHGWGWSEEAARLLAEAED